MAALMQRVVPQLKAMEESEARFSASGSRHSSGKSLSDEARASLTRLSEAVFSGLAKEGCDAAALAEQQVDCCTLQVVSTKVAQGELAVGGRGGPTANEQPGPRLKLSTHVLGMLRPVLFSSVVQSAALCL